MGFFTIDLFVYNIINFSVVDTPEIAKNLR